MKFRGRSSISADDKVVSTATAKKEWFLKDLSGLPSQKIGWNGPTVYAVKDLDRLALKVHGRDGLAKKKEARKKRMDNKTGKGEKNANRKKKRKEDEEDTSRKKRANNDKDDDFVPESEEPPTAKMPSKEKLISDLEGAWVFQDCDEADSDLVLKLSKNGKSMSGNCVISGCEVRLKCNDLSIIQEAALDFQAKFKTQRSSFTGRMLIQLMEKGKALNISYANGASGQGAVRFSDVTARKRK
jgi:hypothetical protein